MRRLCLLTSLLVTFAAGCSSKAALVGPGGTCQVATDCQDGLICIPGKDGTSTCSSNLGSVQNLPPAPVDAGKPAAADAGPGAGDSAAGDSSTGPATDSAAPVTDSAAGD